MYKGKENNMRRNKMKTVSAPYMYAYFTIIAFVEKHAALQIPKKTPKYCFCIEFDSAVIYRFNFYDVYLHNI